MDITLGTLDATDDDAVARLLQRSLHDWYERRLRQGARFGTDPAPFRIFPRVYRRLDAGQEIAARDASGRLVGVCFAHPRETHHSIGIVATDPDVGGRGVARLMVEEALRRADGAGREADRWTAGGLRMRHPRGGHGDLEILVDRARLEADSAVE